MKIKYFSVLLFVIIASCNKETQDFVRDTEFKNEKKVVILDYSGDAMEPFITKDEKYLFFNNLTGENSKDIFFAEKIDDTTFQFLGEVKGVNSSYVDANPTMDTNNNFYFISTRNLDNGSNATVFCGKFESGEVSGLHQITGTINIEDAFWINMGVEVSADGKKLFVSSAKFKSGATFPYKGNIRFAEKDGEEYNIPENEEEILDNINTDDAIEYAGELSSNELELFYSQVTLSKPPVFRLLYAKRNDKNSPFGESYLIIDTGVVEAPTLSNDTKRLYYHKLNENGVYSIYVLFRD